MKVSVCIPCYRSAKMLPTVVDGIKREFEKREEDYQIVLVNDCSPDNTFQVIKELCAEDKKIVGVNLTRNYGQASAKIAALQYATGDVVVFMDDDGQHPAEGIFKLVDKMSEGYDVVYAHFANKKHTAFKKITSNMHNKLAEVMGNKPKGIHRSSFTAWSRPVADAIRDYHSPFVSIGSFMMHVTTNYANVDVEHKERISGSSGYTLKKLFKLWLNIFISFSMLPLRLSTYVGAGCSVVGALWGIYLIIRKILKPSILAGYTSNMVLLLLIGGIIMMMLGIIGEYLGRIYMTVSGMPQFCVRQVVNEEKDK